MLSDKHLPTYSHLRQSSSQSTQERLEIYTHIQNAVAKIDPWCIITITTTKPITDEVIFEGLIRRFVSQLHRTVLGMRKKSKIPVLAVLERGAGSELHAHLLVGKVEGAQRKQEDTDFKHYIQKQLFPAAVKILQRLTFRQGTTKGKIGICDITPIYSKEGLVDYVMKTAKTKYPEIAWLASNIQFQNDEGGK